MLRKTRKAAETAADLPAVTFRSFGQQVAPADVPVLEWVLGERADPGDRWSLEGAHIDAQAVVVRIGGPSAYHLYVRIGADWYSVAAIQRADPVLGQLRDGGHMKARGLSPAQAEAEQRRAEMERQQREADEAYARRRGEHHAELRRRLEERKRLRIAALHAERGDVA